MKQQTSQPSAAVPAQNTDGLRVVLFKDTGTKLWRGTFADFLREHGEEPSAGELSVMLKALASGQTVTLNRGVAGVFELRAELSSGAKHTPAPWIAEKPGNLWQIYSQFGVMVAQVAIQTPQDDGRDLVWEEANARLIAAAPTMFAALNRLQANPNDPRAHREALDAIKLAGGAL